jgi:predicted Zn-dependent protease
LLTLSFSRRQEAEADEKGLERLRAAHVDASGFHDFFLRAGKTASPFQILSSHPDDGSRAELANRFRSYPATPIMGQAGWDRMKTICR